MPRLTIQTQSQFVLSALEFANQAERSGGGVFASTGTVQRTSSDWTMVMLRQEHAGIPILHGVRTVRFNAAGDPVAFTGSSVAVAPGTPVIAKFTAARASHAAFLALLERDLIPSDLTFSSARADVIATTATPPTPTALRKEPFVEPIMASLVVEVTPKQSRLLWEVRLGIPNAGGVYLVRVAATGRTPKVGSVQRLSAHAARAVVNDFDPRGPRVERPLPHARDYYPRFAGDSIRKTPWVDTAETRGNNIAAIDSSNTAVQAKRVRGDLVFDAPDDDPIKQGIIHAFYLCNLMHDFFLVLGFDEQAGNFQENNEQGVGGAGDSLTVIVRDRIVDGWAFFENRPDGTAPTLELGRFHNDRHTALDADIVIHEFVHGVTNRVIGGKGVHVPLEHQQSRALGEGFSDYFAISIQNYYRRRAQREALELSATSPDGGDAGVSEQADPQEWGYAAWLTGSDAGLRTATYENYPNSYDFLKTSKMNNHRAGEVWCAALLELNRALAGEDLDRGDELGWQLVYDSLSFLHPGKKGPTFVHARDALFCAFKALVAKGTIPDDPQLRTAVCKVFQRRGMGGQAKSDGAEFGDAEESKAPIDMNTIGGCQ